MVARFGNVLVCLGGGGDGVGGGVDVDRHHRPDTVAPSSMIEMGREGK